MTDNIVGLDGKPVANAIETSPVIIRILEDTLVAAKAGRMMGCAIATVMEKDREGGTVHYGELGWYSDLFATTAIMQHRMLKFINEG